MKRWYTAPGAMLHYFRGSDDRSYGLHDHPGWFVSIVLFGRISEHVGKVVYGDDGTRITRMLTRNCAAEDWPLIPCKRFRYSPAGHTHAVVLHSRFAITLVFHGRWKDRPWGFFSPDNGRWRDHHEVLGLENDD